MFVYCCSTLIVVIFFSYVVVFWTNEQSSYSLFNIDSFIYPSIHTSLIGLKLDEWRLIGLRTYIHEEKPRGSVGANNPDFGTKTLGLGLAPTTSS